MGNGSYQLIITHKTHEGYRYLDAVIEYDVKSKSLGWVGSARSFERRPVKFASGLDILQTLQARGCLPITQSRMFQDFNLLPSTSSFLRFSLLRITCLLR